jgi:hypothetical protein
MTYGFNTPATGGSEVCPVCSEIYPAANPNCPKCGYAPGTVADSESDQAAQPAVQISYPGATGRNWGALAAVLFTLLGGGIALFVGLDVRDRVSSAFDQVFQSDEFDGVFDSNSSDSPDELSSAACTKKLTQYLRRLFFALAGVDTNATSEGFLDAAAELGGGSREYQALVDIYSTFELNSLAVQGQPRKALKKAVPRVRKACR